jgi:hypothetical protein
MKILVYKVVRGFWLNLQKIARTLVCIWIYLLKPCNALWFYISQHTFILQKSKNTFEKNQKKKIWAIYLNDIWYIGKNKITL